MASTLLSLTPLSADFTSVTAAPVYAIRATHRVLEFADGVDGETYFTSHLPEAYVGLGLTVTIVWMAKTATSGDAVFGASFERHDDEGLDLDAPSFAAEITATATAPGTCGQEQYTTITFLNTEIDSLNGGEEFRIKIRVLGTDSSHTIADTVQIASVRISQAGGGIGFFSEGAGTSSAIGKGLVAPVAAGDNSLAQGTNSSAAGNSSFASGNVAEALSEQSFAQGKNVQIESGAHYTFAQGYNVSVSYSFVPGSFAQGEEITLRSGGSFAQGKFVVVGQDAGSQTAFGEGLLGQGYHVHIHDYGLGVLAQGVHVTTEYPCTGILVQGNQVGNRVGEGGGFGCFAQGLDIELPDSGFGVMLQGQQVYAQNTVNYSLVQGYDLTVDGSYWSLIQGARHAWGAADIHCHLVQGEGNTVNGPYSLIQGRDNVGTGYNLIQGRYCTGSGVQNFVQGLSCFSDGDRGFAQGAHAHALRDDQKTWGSNRAVKGAAQRSTIIKHVQTTDAVQTTLLTFNLEEDRAYAIRVLLAVFNTTTAAEAAAFVVNPSIAYRNTAGAAALTGSPVSLTRTDTGGGAANLLADLASSGNNILLRVTGEASETYEWCASFEVTEVKG